VEEENMTASHPVFKPVTLPDFQNGNDTMLDTLNLTLQDNTFPRPWSKCLTQASAFTISMASKQL
jgi:hypothetical protein